jgi:integrase
LAPDILVRAEESLLQHRRQAPDYSGAHKSTSVNPHPTGSDPGGGLQFPAGDITFSPATPMKRRGKSMSRRRGQNGHFEKSGKWWVVRWWMDVPGQEERVLKRAKVCPISGPGSLSESARKRRGREIVAASGADTVEYFNKVVKQQSTAVLTVREQAERWLEHLRTRKRKPVAEGTIEDWERTLNNWINPHIGDCPVSEVNNGVLKRLVVIMSKADLSAKSIENYVQVPKMVVASVLDEDGNQLYPRKWNHEFIDMPIVEESEQNRPSFSFEIMAGLAKYHRPREQMLFILGGAGGFRVGEELGIEIDKHLSTDCSTITIEQKARRGRVEHRVKNRNAKRQVDLHPEVAKLLKGFIGTRTSGFLFQTKNGTPLSLTNVLRRHLHPALKKLGYVNQHTGDHKAGTHAFRRFRNTFLRNETSCPKGLRDYWLGHAGNSMDDLYDMVKDNVAFRKQKAAEYGIGFELPTAVSIVPNVPKNSAKTKTKKAA